MWEFRKMVGQMPTTPEIDPESLAKLKAEVEAIPPQTGPRAEANRLALKEAVEHLEKENAATGATAS